MNSAGQDGGSADAESGAARLLLGVPHARPRLRPAVSAQPVRAGLRVPGDQRHRVHSAGVRAVRAVRGRASTPPRDTDGTVHYTTLHYRQTHTGINVAVI